MATARARACREQLQLTGTSNATGGVGRVRKVVGVRGKQKLGKMYRKKKVEPRVAASSRVSSGPSSCSEDESESEEETTEDDASSSDDDTSASSFLEDDAEEQEDEKDYKKGGYHPVRIGEVYKFGRYRILRKLGWGHFSTVWLARDKQERCYVAIKVMKSASHYTESAQDEIKLLRCVRETDKTHPHWDKTVKLLDDFKIQGVNGVHICMVFEVLGSNLLKLITDSKNEGIPIPFVKTIMRQLLESLEYLHTKCNIIHTDLKPENILVCCHDESIKTLAAEAEEWLKGENDDIPLSAVNASSADISSKILQPKGKAAVALTKTQKKRLKEKLKKHEGVGLSHSINGNLASKETEPVTIDSKSLNGEPGSVGLKNSLPQEDSDIENCNPNLGEGDKSYGGAGPSNCETPTSSCSEQTTTSVWKDLKIKVADLGNACWTHRHFTSDIQTRQYRCLEVLLGAKYGTSSDIWSTACIAFELATGDYLFDPHSGSTYSRDEDHIAHFIELIGKIPKKVALSGKYAVTFFNRKGELRHIRNLNHWSLKDVLIEKYDWSEEDAASFSDFLLPMLAYDKDSRATATQCLQHPWLN